MTGTEVTDPVSGELRSFAELERRVADLTFVLVTPTPDLFGPRAPKRNNRPH
jgi:hypothetical protein